MPSHLTHIHAPEGTIEPAAYSNVVTGSGRLVVVAGQVARDQRGNLVGPGDAEAQAYQVFENLGLCLAAVGATFDDVVKLTYFVTDIAILPAVRRVRNRYIKTDLRPASTAVQVAALFEPGYLIEVEALAIVAE